MRVGVETGIDGASRLGRVPRRLLQFERAKVWVRPTRGPRTRRVPRHRSCKLNDVPADVLVGECCGEDSSGCRRGEQHPCPEQSCRGGRLDVEQVQRGMTTRYVCHLGNQSAAVGKADAFGELQKSLHCPGLLIRWQCSERTRELAGAACHGGTACSVVPVGGRKQLGLLREGELGVEQVRDEKPVVDEGAIGRQGPGRRCQPRRSRTRRSAGRVAAQRGPRRHHREGPGPRPRDR